MLRFVRQIFRRNAGPFRFESSGRCGVVVYEENNRTLELSWEMSGVSRCDFVIELDLRCWTAPEQTPIAIEEQLQILGKLRAWLQSCGYRTNVDLPKDVAQDNRPCIWAGCEERCYRAMAICPKHYDLSLLRPE